LTVVCDLRHQVDRPTEFVAKIDIPKRAAPAFLSTSAPSNSSSRNGAKPPNPFASTSLRDAPNPST
jgi:hypothetical protein